MTHVHAFQRISMGSLRFRCACGVIGYHTPYRRQVIALTCNHVSSRAQGRVRCGAEAVHADGNNQHNRCAEHAPKQERSADSNAA